MNGSYIHFAPSRNVLRRLWPLIWHSGLLGLEQNQNYLRQLGLKLLPCGSAPQSNNGQCACRRGRRTCTTYGTTRCPVFKAAYLTTFGRRMELKGGTEVERDSQAGGRPAGKRACFDEFRFSRRYLSSRNYRHFFRCIT